MIKQAFITNKFPKDALRQIISPIAKTAESVYTIDETVKPPLRPISLRELCSKHIEAVIAKRLKKALIRTGTNNDL